MKYNLNINQKAIIDNDLDIDIIDGAILDYMYSFSHSSKIMKVFEGNLVYYFFAHKKIVEDLPVLRIKPDAVYRRLKKMCDLGLILQHPNSKQLRMTLYAFTDVIQSLYFDDVTSKAETSDKNPMPIGGNAETSVKTPNIIGDEPGKSSVKNPNYNNTSNNSTTNNSKYPDVEEFVRYALDELEKRGEVRAYEYEYSIRDKYEQWSSANWVDGYGSKIKNWRSKIKNGFKYLHRYTNANSNNQNRVGKTDGNERIESIGLFVTES